MFNNSPNHKHPLHKLAARKVPKNHTLQHSKVALIALINANIHDYTDDRDTSDGQLISS